MSEGKSKCNLGICYKKLLVNNMISFAKIVEISWFEYSICVSKES